MSLENDPVAVHTFRNQRAFLKYFLRWYLPVAFLVVLGGYLVAYYALGNLDQDTRIPERFRIELAAKQTSYELKRPYAHLKSLAYLEPTVQKVLDGKLGKPSLEEPFLTLLLRNPEYAQIRWIGNDGMERFRAIRSSNGEAQSVPDKALQNKGDRYYVRETLTLPKGAVYVSPLDLNVEYGQIEVPYQPTIRLATRVYRSDGSPVGLFVLNISMLGLLDRLESYGSGGDIALLNPEGYWLKSKNPEDEWGFMLHKQDTFGKRYPDAWKILSLQDAGQEETAKGLWTWRTIHVTAQDTFQPRPVYWKIVSRVSHETLTQHRNAVLYRIVLAVIAILLLYELLLWKLAEEQKARADAEADLLDQKAELEQVNARLELQIKERREAQALLELRNHELSLSANVLNTMADGVVITRPDGEVVSVNPAYCVMTGYQPEELIGKKPSIQKSGKHDETFYQGLWGGIAKNGYWTGQIWNRHKNGREYLVRETISAILGEDGHLENYVGVLTDITEAKQKEEAVRFQAYHDALTGLPNRTLLYDRLKQSLAYSRRNRKRFAVLYIDLDGFKAINDTYGHEAGDKVLIETARRLRACLRESDTLARLGGDEFVIVLDDITKPEDVSRIGSNLLQSLAKPYALPEGKTGYLSGSVGVAIYPDAGVKVETLLSAADEAMYVSKQNGKNMLTFAG